MKHENADSLITNVIALSAVVTLLWVSLSYILDGWTEVVQRGAAITAFLAVVVFLVRR